MQFSPASCYFIPLWSKYSALNIKGSIKNLDKYKLQEFENKVLRKIFGLMER
jgi:hypothetical protein